MKTWKEVEADVALKIFWLEDPPVATWKYFQILLLLTFSL